MITRFQDYSKSFVSIFFLLQLCTSFAYAISPSLQENLGPDITSAPVLPTVTVEASRLDPLTGGTTLDLTQIEKIPARNGNTSDLLKLVPGIQMPKDADSSQSGGEIAPAAISISGGRSYDNNFLIDGIGNNSLLDPQFDLQGNINNVPGHPQEIFLLNNLVKEMSVLRSNIPARYGGFTGGVIDIKTIDPSRDFGGKISYRTAHSDWSRMHVDPTDQDAFDNSISEDNQPRFFKQNATATLHTPFNSSSGMVFDYSILDSDIPLQNLGLTETQQRRTVNYFTKYKNDLNAETSLSLSGLYAPYEGEYFLKETKYSTYTIKGGGYNLTGKLEKNTDLGETELTLATKTSYNSRRSPENYYNWRNTGIKDWGSKSFSKEGGYGDIDKEQQSITGNLHHQFNTFRAGSSFHRFNAGVSLEQAETKYNRLDETSIYSVASANSSVDCNGDNSDCIDGQQFMWFKNIYPKDNASARMTQIAAYAEDKITIARLTLRPGLRGSWDDYLENINISPRLAAAYDLFANEKTTVIAGMNRYYGRNLLTIKLDEQKQPYTRWRRSTTLVGNIPQPWAELPRSSIPASRVADLDTPYSDEYTIGLRQQLLGGLLELDYIDRQGYDLIVSRIYDKDPVTNIVFSEWSNAGRSHHQQVNFSWNRSWEKSTVTIAATWQKTTGNSDTYTDSDADFTDLVWLNGQVGTLDDLLLDDYNRPFRSSLVYTVNFSNKLQFTNTTTYRSPYKSVIATGDTHLLPDGTPIDIYEEFSNDQALIFDWRLAYELLRKNNLGLTLTLDVYNLFDQQTNLGASTTDYELGRQVWIGASCEF